jgi:CheY-like chemotaxis protein
MIKALCPNFPKNEDSMKRDEIYSMVKASVNELRKQYPELQPLDAQVNRDATFADYGFDVFTLGLLERDLEERMDGRKLDMESFLVPEAFYEVTVGQMLDFIEERITTRSKNPIVVYVDDEEENLFIFRRKLGKDFNLKLFSDPQKALDFINTNSEVALVITDEVMPGLRGNKLCEEVRRAKPFMKFILITGNPENDENLMYKSLRRGRFYEFIQKPVDFDGKRKEYIELINSIM